MKKERLLELMDRFGDLRIAVVGDLFLDRWYDVDRRLDEPSLETGLTAYQVVAKRPAAGAAGTVMNNLAALGVGKIYAIVLLGDDGDGYDSIKAMKRRGIDTSLVVSSEEVWTPTYNKTTFVAEGMPPEETNRLDVKNRKITPDHLQDQLIANVRKIAGEVDAIVLLDQLMEENCGVVTDRMLAAIDEIAAEYPDLLIYGDSRGFIHKFRNMIIKCNNHEALGLVSVQDSGEFEQSIVEDAMDQIRARTGRPVFISCNKFGVMAQWEGKKHLVPAVRHNCEIDVCGAGDACSAGIISALAAGGTHVEAAEMGNLSSGVTVRMLGETGAAERTKVLALFDEQNA